MNGKCDLILLDLDGTISDPIRGIAKSINYALVALGFEEVSESTMMIGDRSVDLAAAHASGLTSAGVLWGYGSREELERENPSRLFESPEEWHILEELTNQG